MTSIFRQSTLIKLFPGNSNVLNLQRELPGISEFRGILYCFTHQLSFFFSPRLPLSSRAVGWAAIKCIPEVRSWDRATGLLA